MREYERIEYDVCLLVDTLQSVTRQIWACRRWERMWNSISLGSRHVCLFIGKNRALGWYVWWICFRCLTSRSWLAQKRCSLACRYGMSANPRPVQQDNMRGRRFARTKSYIWHYLNCYMPWNLEAHHLQQTGSATFYSILFLFWIANMSNTKDSVTGAGNDERYRGEHPSLTWVLFSVLPGVFCLPRLPSLVSSSSLPMVL